MAAATKNHVTHKTWGVSPPGNHENNLHSPNPHFFRPGMLLLGDFMILWNIYELFRSCQLISQGSGCLGAGIFLYQT